MTINIPKPAPIWLSETEVRDLVKNARKAKADLLSVIAGIDARIAERRKVLTTSLADLDTKARLAAIDSAASTVKVTLKAESNPRRTELLRSLARMADTARSAIPLWDSPVVILMRQTVASERRATIAGNLEASGKQELGMFASLAISAKDVDMAAATISKLHTITPASARPVSAKYVADQLVGDLSRELHGALLEVDSLLTEAALANRIFESGRSGSSGIGSVELALKHRRDAAVGGKRVEDDADDE